VGMGLLLCYWFAMRSVLKEDFNSSVKELLIPVGRKK